MSHLRWIVRPILLTIFALLAALTLLISVSDAGSPPGGQPQVGPPYVSGPGKVRPQRFYGYVPPPPVRQTWPGGYKVIFHELSNTLSEHILGQY